MGKRWIASVSLCLVACSRDQGAEAKNDATATTAPARPEPAAADAEPLPRLLYLPDGSLLPPPVAAPTLLPGMPAPPRPGSGACPPDMVDIEGRFCIDRFEAHLVDAASGRALSPHYPPNRALAVSAYARWTQRRLETGTDEARRMPLPDLPAFQRTEDFSPRAVSAEGVLPNGHVSQTLAKAACENAGKRLCREEEWTTACRGQERRRFPYGDDYDRTRCNVFRFSHPALILHGDASKNHDDPRLNLTTHQGQPLLRRTGATPSCKSAWGADGVYDMVGNLDEWVDDDEGVFVGGFFSRNTKNGCEARVSAHGPTYFDYSLGVRCCK